MVTPGRQCQDWVTAWLNTHITLGRSPTSRLRSLSCLSPSSSYSVTYIRGLLRMATGLFLLAPSVRLSGKLNALFNGIFKVLLTNFHPAKAAMPNMQSRGGLVPKSLPAPRNLNALDPQPSRGGNGHCFRGQSLQEVTTNTRNSSEFILNFTSLFLSEKSLITMNLLKITTKIFYKLQFLFLKLHRRNKISKASKSASSNSKPVLFQCQE